MGDGESDTYRSREITMKGHYLKAITKIVEKTNECIVVSVSFVDEF